jgi:hypothetical protein
MRNKCGLELLRAGHIRRFDPLLKGLTSPVGESQPTENQTLTETGKSAGAPENQNLVF